MIEHIKIIEAAADLFWDFCREILRQYGLVNPQWWNQRLQEESKLERHLQIITAAARQHPGVGDQSILDYQACVKLVLFYCFDWLRQSYPEALAEDCLRSYRESLRRAVDIRNEVLGHKSQSTIAQYDARRLDRDIRCYRALIKPFAKIEEFSACAGRLQALYDRHFTIGSTGPIVTIPVQVSMAAKSLTCSEKVLLHACVESGIPILEDSSRVFCKDWYRTLGQSVRCWITPQGVTGQADSPCALAALPVLRPFDQLSQPLRKAALFGAKALQQLTQHTYFLLDESFFLSSPGRDFLEKSLAPALEGQHVAAFMDSASLRLISSFACLTLEDMQGYPQMRARHREAVKGYACLSRLLQSGALQINASLDPDVPSDENLLSVLTQAPEGMGFCLLSNNHALAQRALELERESLLVLYRPDGETVQRFLPTHASGALPKSTLARQLRGRLPQGTPEDWATKSNKQVTGDTLLSARLPQVGEPVTIEGFGQTLMLGETIAQGGEGVLYQTSDEQLVAKIYHQNRLTRQRRDKLHQMLRGVPPVHGLCWPLGILTNDTGEFVGYLMERVAGQELARSVFHPLAGRLTGLPGWQRIDLIRLCITICKTLQVLHRNHVLMGDVNGSNILIVNSGRIFLVDTDSYQLAGYPCPVGMPLYAPPELRGAQDFSTLLRTPAQEWYALAVLMFQILLPGKSPYTVENGKVDYQDFPFKFGDVQPGDTIAGCSGVWRIIWSNLPFKMKEAFYKAFVEKSYLSPHDWILLLQSYEAQVLGGEQTGALFPTTFKEVGGVFQSRICPKCGSPFNIADELAQSKEKKGEQICCKLCEDLRTVNEQITCRIQCSVCKEIFTESRYALAIKGEAKCQRCSAAQPAKASKLIPIWDF